jgi:hypothetical protein
VRCPSTISSCTTYTKRKWSTSPATQTRQAFCSYSFHFFISFLTTFISSIHFSTILLIAFVYSFLKHCAYNFYFFNSFPKHSLTAFIYLFIYFTMISQAMILLIAFSSFIHFISHKFHSFISFLTNLISSIHFSTILLQLSFIHFISHSFLFCISFLKP